MKYWIIYRWLRAVYFFITLVGRKWGYGKDDDLAFRIDSKTAWNVAKIIWDIE